MALRTARKRLVRETAALVADLLIRTKVILGVGVGGLVDGLLDGSEGDHFLCFGLTLDHDPDALFGLLHDEGNLPRDVCAPAALVLTLDTGLPARLPVRGKRDTKGVLRRRDQGASHFGERLLLVQGPFELSLRFLYRFAQCVQLGRRNLRLDRRVRSGDFGRGETREQEMRTGTADKRKEEILIEWNPS